MNWIQCLSKALNYIEDNLTDGIDIDAIASQAYTTSSHFQLVFHLVMGMTVGEYIRHRRLSCAAQDLLKENIKIIDVAMRYQYGTGESFSKAFTRFHGVPPSKVQRRNIKLFHPLSINVTIQGGFEMSRKLDAFYWNDFEGQDGKKLTDSEKYKKIATWAGKARGQNPNVFDALTEWILDDAEWTDEKLAENEQILMQSVLGRFKEQNAQLREYLLKLAPTGVVNEVVFNALDRFDANLAGQVNDKQLQKVVTGMFSDFSTMHERDVRKQIAGNKTGPFGTKGVSFVGYINYLKECDAQVQWTLFMPFVVKQQQSDFKVDSFEYVKMPAIRFVGRECTGHDPSDISYGLDIMCPLDSMPEYKSGFDYDIMFMHHFGKAVDVEHWHGFWGRFMKADTPVPDGFVHFDLVPDDTDTPYLTFRSQFAFAKFSGNIDAMHKREGYDSDAMYDVTRNIILGQDVIIPYPETYWTAEVFLDGCNHPGTAYLFGVAL